MAITYPLNLPTVSGIAKINFRTINAVSVSRSPFTFKEQIISHTGQRLEADISLPPMKEEDAEVWIAFLISLKGQTGTFLLGDPAGATPRGSANETPGTPLVNGAGQTGESLTVDGLPASATGYLKAGDYIQLGAASSAKLYKVLQDVDTDSDGQATIELFPSIRTAPADDAVVTVSGAQGVFRLSSNETNWSINEASFYGISFGAVEAIA